MADSASASPSTSGTIKLKLKLGKSHYTAAVAQTPPVLSPVPVHQPAITLPSESNASSQPPAQPSISGNSDSTTQTPNAELTSAADDAEMVEHDEYRDEESVQDLLSLSTPTTHIVTSLDAQQTAEPVPHSSVGHIVLPPVAQNKKKKKPPASATPSTSDLNGNGKGWRKGLKGNQKPEGAFASTSTLQTKRKRNTGSLAEDDLANAEFGDPSDEYIPQMVAPGGLATSDKWANGLPGGNEQSRATAAMASAVNKAFPVGAPPKTGSGFLTAIPLDRRTPSVRKWTKTKREVVGPNGIAYLLPVWMGGELETTSAVFEAKRLMIKTCCM